MAPQILNMELLLTSHWTDRDAKPTSHGENQMLKQDFSKQQVPHKRRKSSFGSVKQFAIDPIHMIQTLLTPGISAASCNEETLSSSFLILDGLLTISLGELTAEGRETKYNMLEDATERWGARFETNIGVGKVCYEYRHETEEEEEKCMSCCSSVGDDECNPSQGNILSQTLDLIPLVLDESLIDIRAINPDGYIPPSHKMVADCLKVRQTQHHSM